MRPVRLAALTVALIAPLAVPAASHATYAGVDEIFAEDLRLIVNGSADVNDYIDVSFTGGVLTISDEAGVVAGPNCSRVDPGDNRVVQCATATSGRSLRYFQFSGSSGNDGLRVHTTLPNGIGAYFDAGEGHDIIKGSPATDVIRPGAGQDFVEAHGGDDQLDAGNTSDGVNDTFHLGEGTDEVQYGRAAGVTISMSQITAGAGTAGTGSEGDDLTGVESFMTGTGDDQLIGGPGADRVRANGGDDVLFGGGGDDELYGDAGEDHIAGDGGDDELEGGADADDLVGGEDDDVLRAQDGMADAVACDDDPEEIDTPGTADVVYLDPGVDPDDPACEVVAPRFTGTPAIAGSLNAGSTLGLTGTQTTGRPAASVTATWWSCANEDYDDCEELATGATYVPADADVGRWLYAEVRADNGGVGWAETELVGPVGEALPPPVDDDDDAPGDGTGGGQQQHNQQQSQNQQQNTGQQQQNTQQTPLPPSGDVVAAQLLQSAFAGLGRKGALRRLPRGLNVAFTAGRAGTALVEVLSGAPRAAAKKKVRVLARGGRTYAAAGAGAIKVRLTKAGKKLRRARSAKVVVRVTFAPPGEQAVVLTRRVTLKR